MRGLYKTGLLCVLQLLLGVSGCQPGPEPLIMGIVAGNVTFRGKPVASGVVSFENKSEGVGATAKIADGKFTVEGPISAGHYQVTVLPPQIEPPLPGAPPPVIKDPADIPAKYRSTVTSDLAVDIHEGENKVDFDLKP